MADDSRNNLDIILDGLRKYGRDQKDAGGTRMICCPFHEDDSPSCGVSLDISSKIPLGFFNCLGCQAKGPWNVLADKAGLEKIQAWNSVESRAQSIVTPEFEDKLLGGFGMTMKSLLKTMHCPEAQDWPVDMDWRGFPGKLVNAVGGKIISDDYKDSIAVLFPIKIGDRIRGAVKAIYEKRNKKDLAYMTMKGSWAKDYGLFPYAYTKKLMKARGYKFVVLVEGPRDCLRLLLNGIPALAVLGANNMSKLKAMLILSLEVDFIYGLPDNDKGGDLMWANIKQAFAGQAEVKRFRLPDGTVKTKMPDGTIKEEKIDPGNMPRRILRDLAVHLYRQHGYAPKSGKLR